VSCCYVRYSLLPISLLSPWAATSSRARAMTDTPRAEMRGSLRAGVRGPPLDRSCKCRLILPRPGRSAIIKPGVVAPGLALETRREWASSEGEPRDAGFFLGGLTHLNQGFSESDLPAPQSVLRPPARQPWLAVAGAAAMCLRAFDLYLPFLQVSEASHRIGRSRRRVVP